MVGVAGGGTHHRARLYVFRLYVDLKPLVNSYTQQLVQTKWDVAVHDRYIYLLKPTLGPPQKFQHLTRAE